MNGPELLKKMKGNDECWRIFQAYIQNKEQMMGSRLHKMDYVYHKQPVKIEKKLFENVQRQYPSLAAT
jgi:glycine/serine hydroxymethyltransferase